MPVARRIGLKIDEAGAASENAIFTGHKPFPVHGFGLRYLCTIMHVNAGVQSLLPPQICILLHILAPSAIQSALESDASASLAFRCVASAATGKLSANPPPALAALRVSNVLISASASPRCRAAARGFCVRSFRLAL